MRIRCRLGWHEWTKFGLPKSCYGQLTQFRECSECGVVNSKKGYHEQASPASIEESISEGKATTQQVTK